MPRREPPRGPGVAISAEPVQRFKPTTGVVAGYLGLAVMAAIVVGVVVEYRTLVGLRVALAAMFLAVVVWSTQLRPRAVAYPTVLELRNSLRDYWVPYTLIDEVTVAQTLSVWVGERRYVCIGIGASVRADLKARQREAAEASVHLKPGRDLVTSYRTFVLTTIDELVRREKRRVRLSDRPGPSAAVERRVAVPELVALLASALLLALSFVV